MQRASPSASPAPVLDGEEGGDAGTPFPWSERLDVDEGGGAVTAPDGVLL